MTTGHDTAERTRRATPIRRRALDRQHRIINVTGQLVAEQGLGRVTTQGVAAASDSSIGIVYRMFADINDVLAAVGENNLALILAELSERDLTRGGAAESIGDALSNLIDTVPGFREINVGSDLPATAGDPWLTVADFVIQRLGSGAAPDAQLLAAAIAGAHTITGRKTGTGRTAVVKQLLHGVIAGE